MSRTRSGSSAAVFKPTSSELRTDESYRLRSHPDLHLSSFSNPGSVLLESLGVGMISQFPVDPMHSVDLGVMKLILRKLIKRKIYGAPLNKPTIAEMNSYFCSFARHTPTEFQRKPRDLLSSNNFKATECRQILLYTGMVIFKKYFSDALYVHFLSLSIAYRFLNSPLNDDNLKKAQDYLEYFVQNFKHYYTEEQLVFNVHSLLHLVADCKLYGPCYEFSAYKFENEMGRIRGMVRSQNRKLEQIYNRCTENMLFNKNCTYSINSLKVVPNDQDSYFLLNDSRIVRVEIVNNNDLIVRSIIICNELFLQPINSSSLGIHVCKLGEELGTITRDCLVSKLYRVNLPEDGEDDDDCDDWEEDPKQDMNQNVHFVVIPLLHF